MSFLNLSKAYDDANHCFLCTKLANRGVPLLLVFWIRSYQAYHPFQMRTGDEVFEDAAVSDGVPAGLVIEPPLLLIMINDLPDGIQLFYQLFADGTKVVSKSLDVDLIQCCLDKTAAYAV